MNTFLLYWNPHFSSYTLERFAGDFNFKNSVYENCLTLQTDPDAMPEDFDWSIVEHEKAREGDRFIFIRVGYEKPTGIVGVGVFTSEPYQGEDWSGQGRDIWYMAMEFDAVVNPESDKVLPTAEIAALVPEVDWTKGKAGVMVSPETAGKILAAWDSHLCRNCFKEEHPE